MSSFIEEEIVEINGERYRKKCAITDYFYEKVLKTTGETKDTLTKEDVFYYIYGVLNNKDYRKKFEYDLKKSLPRIPTMPKDLFWAHSKAGRELSYLHLNYENIPANKDCVVEHNDLLYYEKLVKGSEDEYKYYEVKKIKYANKDKTTIIFNENITIKNIPLKAQEYVINGKSGIDWILDRYNDSTDKDSQIRNNANDWCREVQNPRYILDLLLSVIEVSVESVDIIDNLPSVDWESLT